MEKGDYVSRKRSMNDMLPIMETRWLSLPKLKCLWLQSVSSPIFGFWNHASATHALLIAISLWITNQKEGWFDYIGINWFRTEDETSYNTKMRFCESWIYLSSCNTNSRQKAMNVVSKLIITLLELGLQCLLSEALRK